MSQPQNEDVAGRARRFSPALFGIVAICFFLPFVALTCAGQELFDVRGIDLVTGTEITEEDLSGDVRDTLGQFEDLGSETTTETTDEGDKLDPQLWAIVALVVAVAGLIVGFALRDKNGPKLSAIFGIVGAVSLILLRVTFDVEGEADTGQEIGSIDVGYDWRLGWWLALLLFLVQPLLHLTSRRRIAAAGDRSLPNAPPPPSTGGPSGAS